MKIAETMLLAMCVTSTLLPTGSEKIQRLLGEYDNIEYSHQYVEFYRKLFAVCWKAELETLSTNKNDSIATQAAWEIVTLTVPEQNGPKAYRPNPKKLQWFIGFLEGRNRIVTPKWWREVVLDARANRRDNIYPGELKKRIYHRSDLKGVRCPVGASVTETDKTVTHRHGDDSITLPEELLCRADSGALWCNVSCTFTDERCFVAVHDNVGYSHDVACIDRKTGSIVRKSKACGCWWGGTTGQHHSWVTFVLSDDGRLFVFGSGSVGFYAHGFDGSNGKTLMRFSSNY